jgi:hypothetical protein
MLQTTKNDLPMGLNGISTDPVTLYRASNALFLNIG